MQLIDHTYSGFLQKNSVMALEKELNIQENIHKFKHRVISLQWADKNNDCDCGVYCMAHMKKYIGDPKDFECLLLSQNTVTVRHLYFYEIMIIISSY